MVHIQAVIRTAEDYACHPPSEYVGIDEVAAEDWPAGPVRRTWAVNTVWEASSPQSHTLQKNNV